MLFNAEVSNNRKMLYNICHRKQSLFLAIFEAFLDFTPNYQ
jgi:hypothetical protein